MVGLRKWLVNFSAVVGTTAAFSVFNNSAGRCGFAQTGYALAGFGRCWLVSFCGIRAAVYGHFDMAADGGVERASVRFTLARFPGLVSGSRSAVTFNLSCGWQDYPLRCVQQSSGIGAAIAFALIFFNQHCPST